MFKNADDKIYTDAIHFQFWVGDWLYSNDYQDLYIPVDSTESIKVNR